MDDGHAARERVPAREQAIPAPSEISTLARSTLLAGRRARQPQQHQRQHRRSFNWQLATFRGAGALLVSTVLLLALPHIIVLIVPASPTALSAGSATFAVLFVSLAAMLDTRAAPP